ncbi:unnamed protein product [Microthlaspi erraticum]|uniref:DUF4283 domain-containing protein n=1 Tax=Microthlaspi erraticum TaxID=1685480 RepID=A0A6D2KWT5_9BRAS|nr:unnamed protein product [Microthlaspi erraticum]
MSQASRINGGGSNEGKEKLAPRLKITVPRFDNTELIRGYSRTLIGRCMNPMMQDVQSLLHVMPRIWKVEERVAVANLGLGRFQFDFDNEEDIVEVLKMEPFHFDNWMVALVRWQPVVDPSYPSAIIFWVCLDGYKPLTFETTVEFHSGDETLVVLRYERLFGFCRECSSLCHDVVHCPLLRKAREEREKQTRREDRPDGGSMSYKGVVINGPQSGNGGIRPPPSNQPTDYKGKGKAVDTRKEKGLRHTGFRGKARHGEESSVVHRVPKRYMPTLELRKLASGTTRAGGSTSMAGTGTDGRTVLSPSYQSAKKAGAVEVGVTAVIENIPSSEQLLAEAREKEEKEKLEAKVYEMEGSWGSEEEGEKEGEAGDEDTAAEDELGDLEITEGLQESLSPG